MESVLSVKPMDFYSAMSGTVSSKIDGTTHSRGESKPTPQEYDPEHGINERMERQRVDALMEHTAKLQKHNTTLQQQNSSLKDTIHTLTKSNQSTEEELRERVKLQAQLHADQLKTLQVKDRTLTERCQTLAAFAEQHRLAGLKHEQKNKSLTQELQSMAAVQVAGEGRHRTAMEEVKRLESTVKSRDKDVLSLQENIISLQSNIQILKQEHHQKLECVSGRLEKARALLKASPYSAHAPHTTSDSLKSSLDALKSSAEVMKLAHTHGGVDSMRECLGQVGAVLKDLHGELQSQHRLAGEWQQRVDALGL